MKKHLILLLFLAGFNLFAASPVNTSQFLFEEFQEAVVFLKNRQQTIEKVNVNLIDGKLYFIDKKDDRMKIVSGIENIISFKIDNRIFLVSLTELKEVLQTNPFIYVQYMAKSRPKDVTVGYGGTSTLTSTTTYSRLQGQDDGLLKDTNRELTERYNVYWMVKNKKEKKFQNAKQFLKIYPKEKQEILMRYIDENKISFQDVDQVVALCLYAESL